MGERNFLPFWPHSTVEEKFRRHTELLPELSQTVPQEVLLGYHWCYGTWGGWPMSEMQDLRLCVELSNAAVAAAGRQVDYVHMPVVREPGGEDFGVAGVCGYGRVDPEELPEVLRVHRECAQLLPGRG